MIELGGTVNDIRPVRDQAAFAFLVARIDETDDHEATKRMSRAQTRSLWIAQDRTDSGGEMARRGVRAALQVHQEHEDFNPAWLA